MLSMQKLATCACALIAVNCCAFIQAGFASHLPQSAGTYSAGFIGNYAGHLSGGKAVSELHQSQPEVGEESHDFSDDGAAHYGSESLGSLGDHLEEHSFPADYGHGGEDAQHEAAAEYAEAASEHHEEYESYGGGGGAHEEEQHYQHQAADYGSDHESLNAIDLGGGWHSGGGGDYFDSKPVVGIDHGKGAFSYSTLYENEDEKSSSSH